MTDLIKDLNEIKGIIGENCFYLLGSYARFQLEQVVNRDKGVDFHLIRISNRNGRTRVGGHILDFQVKATHNWSEKNGEITYSLKGKNYNDIIARNIDEDIPLILIVMCMPEDYEEWGDFTNDYIKFKHCCYWYHTPDIETISEDSTKTVKIPIDQRLTPESFGILIDNYKIARV